MAVRRGQCVLLAGLLRILALALLLLAAAGCCCLAGLLLVHDESGEALFLVPLETCEVEVGDFIIGLW